MKAWNSRFSRPVSTSSSDGSWKTSPMRWRTRAGSRTTSMPATRAVPAVGVSSVQRIEMVVDFPAPLGPRKPNISPWRTSRSMPRTASSWPYRLTRPSACITALSRSCLAEAPRISEQPAQHIGEVFDLLFGEALEQLSVDALKCGCGLFGDRYAGVRQLDGDQPPVAATYMPHHHALCLEPVDEAGHSGAVSPEASRNLEWARLLLALPGAQQPGQGRLLRSDAVRGELALESYPHIPGNMEN